ncbi:MULTISPECIES: M3 family metallopeptidase [Acidobacterium]|uniref:Peptidase, M3 family n=1 Tax=Acidobacterium capsulatum (strain ATCC 51196 / DSM 11244 / BCRC 80197 / JCM 7670 / NBRC 15755 / NCIMB 13165 / 161) TaxID=240015 RepID=C1F9R9_ACIC5|nr:MULTISPECIES: M3 family metallopeptidase [Acidobacterium]ACO34631.1 peptidase, M3 family [Acidobacterium capsulatum ATCC 51196]HCT62272.1 peptidase M3 [Acidobacterium sp.]
MTAAENQSTHPQSTHPWNPSGRPSGNASGQPALTPHALDEWVAARLAAYQGAIDRLLAVEGPRTPENSLRAYDEAVAELGLTGSQVGLLDSVYPDKAIRDKAQELSQKIAQVGVLLGLNRQVYEALAAIPLDGLDAATRHYLERTLLQYRLSGVDKDDATRQQLQALQEKATLAALTFGRNVQESANLVIVEDAAELDGLPPDFLAAHPAATEGEHKGKIVLTTDFPDYLPVMTFARSGDLRRRMQLAYNTRAYPQNRQILLDLLTTRREIANLLGFETWADLATADQMMESAANMQAFLDELAAATKEGAEREYAMILDFARRQQPGLEQIDAASRAYWLEQYRRSAFDFDSQAVRPYFPYERVQAGVLATAEKLFRVEFRPIAQPDVWHPSVTAWEVHEAGQLVGRFYLDMHPREGKDKWFSAHPLIPGVAGRQLPEAALICNFPEPKPGAPALLQYSDVVTYFHEFGHLMHALLGGRQRWAGQSGIATEGDFVEVPSQLLEEFFRDPALLASFAHHYQTNEPIPAALVERMNRAGAFGRADWVRTQIYYTTYSLETHRIPPAELDPDQLLEDLYRRFLPYRWLDGNKMYASFTHLVGYSSNYYTYLYDKVIALDFFDQFPRTELLDPATAQRYRNTVLEAGGSMPGKQIVEAFLGRKQSMQAFTEWVGEEFEAVEAAS